MTNKPFDAATQQAEFEKRVAESTRRIAQTGGYVNPPTVSTAMRERMTSLRTWINANKDG